MPVGLDDIEQLLPVAGVQLAVAASAMRYQGRNDLLLMQLNKSAVTACSFTRNAFRAAPVIVASEHLNTTNPRYLLINAGNANAGTGEAGLQAAKRCCSSVADIMGVSTSEVLPFSTGVIGEQLETDKITHQLAGLKTSLEDNHWVEAANAIKTTDVVAKGCSEQFKVEGVSVTITGIVKGSGMICPNMATLLSFIATDAKLDKTLLEDCLQRSIADSFNAITVDGDTSTNDCCTLTATGESAVEIRSGDALQLFQDKLGIVMRSLAQSVIRDAEGATKFITVSVEEATDKAEARSVAYTVAQSPLVKTALYASDPNWGRILAAVGRAPIDDLDIAGVSLYLGEICLIKRGQPDENYTEEKGLAETQKDDIELLIRLNRGEASARIWTSDLSEEYVKINADYRS